MAKETKDVELELIGIAEVYYMIHTDGFDYNRVEEDGEVFWYVDGDRDPEWAIKDDLADDLEERFQILQHAEFDKELMKRCLTNEHTLELLKDVMNLGMGLRQDQLNGFSDKSGNELLGELIASRKAKWIK